MNTVKIEDLISGVPPGDWMVVVQAKDASGAVISEASAPLHIPVPPSSSISVGVPTVTVVTS